RGQLGRGAGLRVLAEATTSPFETWAWGRLLAAFPEARITYLSSPGRAARFEGARVAFGRPAEALVDFSAARVVASFADDFLATGPYASRYARDFARRRAPSVKDARMSRLYVAEPRLSCTGSTADERRAVR